MFLARESELRYLRKTVTDQEQEVSVLDKHIENMNNGILKLITNTEQLKAGCLIYEDHLDKLRSKVVDAFASIKLPGKNMFINYRVLEINYVLNVWLGLKFK